MEARRGWNAAAWMLLLAAVHGCGSPTTTPQTPPRATGEPLVRVRIGRAVPSITITGPTRIRISVPEEPERAAQASTPLTIERRGGGWVLPAGPAAGWRAAEALVIEPVGVRSIWLGTDRYPGEIRFIAVRTEQTAGSSPASDSDRFDVVNHVRLEAYLPGVLERELYDDWHAAAYHAQAIAARSFALERIIHRDGRRHFDLESTQASQAYGGSTAHRLALRAVADTVGLVLTHNGRIIPAYYSSTCGGIGQSADDAFGNGASIPPLEPSEPHQWCAASDYYRWGPIARDRRDLSRRIRAWGREHGLSPAKLERVESIRVARRNRLGRPVRFEIVDSRGASFVLRAESLRHAANHASEAEEPDPLPALPRRSRLPSGFFEAEVRGERVVFSQGRGFGHGVGLCQYAAEGMARAGYDPLTILAHAYPRAKVERAY